MPLVVVDLNTILPLKLTASGVYLRDINEKDHIEWLYLNNLITSELYNKQGNLQLIVLDYFIAIHESGSLYT